MEEPCKKLWLSVLEQAIREAQNEDHEAREWFRSENKDVGSFQWICSMLGIEPNLIRWLINLKK